MPSEAALEDQLLASRNELADLQAGQLQKEFHDWGTGGFLNRPRGTGPTRHRDAGGFRGGRKRRRPM
eukprot:6055619-Alexandrium_andersonii.AAC.1